MYTEKKIVVHVHVGKDTAQNEVVQFRAFPYGILCILPIHFHESKNKSPKKKQYRFFLIFSNT